MHPHSPDIDQTRSNEPSEVDNADSTPFAEAFIKPSRHNENQLSDIDIKDHGVLSRLLCGSLSLFDIIIRNSVSMKLLHSKDQNILKRCYLSLKLWDEGHGVCEGKLDQKLERSRNLRDTTLLTLISLCRVLLNVSRKLNLGSPYESHHAILNAQILLDQTKYMLSTFDEDSSDSDSDSDNDNDNKDHDSNQSSEDIDGNQIFGFVEVVKTYTECLVDLSTALECAAVDPDIGDEPVLPRLQERSAHEYYADLIQSKFPKAEFYLADCLGKASWNRYKRLQTMRERNEQTAAVLITGGTWSTVAKTFKESGLRTNLDAESVISYVSNLSNGQRLHIPPLSAEAKKGEKFKCSACGDFIIATSNRFWRGHIFNDLQPYTCLFPDCNFSSTPFVNRRLWIDHLDIKHQFGPDWESKQCPLCLEPTGDGKSSSIIHLSRHMEDIALTSLPRGVDSEATSEADSASLSDLKSVSTTNRSSRKKDTFHALSSAPVKQGSGADHASKPWGPLEKRVEEFGRSETNNHTCHDCKKEFKRPGDLARHEKTHSRPWKCTYETCKYFELGWYTEQERDNHIDTEHSSAPAQYKCLYPPCPWSFRRESNVKQHMEKAHGWEYEGTHNSVTKETCSRLLSPTCDETELFPGSNICTQATEPIQRHEELKDVTPQLHQGPEETSSTENVPQSLFKSENKNQGAKRNRRSNTVHGSRLGEN